ncbi:putative amino-acid metabolite efflux pump [compost metagenome]
MTIMKIEAFFRSRTGIVVASVIATILWGSAFPFIKLSYRELGIQQGDVYQQILFAGYRFTLSGLIIICFMSVNRQRIALVPSTLKRIVRVSLVQTFLQYLFIYIGLSRSSSAVGSITSGAISFFQLILAHFLFKEDQLNPKKMVGIVFGFMGLILLFSKGDHTFQFGSGDILLFCGAFSASLGNILSKVESRHISVFYLNAYQMLLGGIALICISSWKIGIIPFHFETKSMLLLLYLSMVSAVSFILWNYLLKCNPVGKVSMYMFLVPLFGVGWSMLLLHEHIQKLIWVSLVLVISGIIIVNRDFTEKKVNIYGSRSRKY